MGTTRFHQLGLNTFNDVIPGGLPSDEDRAKFLGPDLGNKNMSEHDIGIQLNNTIKSILNVAGAEHKLSAFFTAYHKARSDHGNSDDTVDDLGVYLTTEAAKRVTHLLKKDITRSKFTRNHLEEDSFGRREWYWMAILGEVKSNLNPTCAFSMIPRSFPSPEAAAAPHIASNNDPSVPMSSSQVPSPSVGLQDNTDAIPATAESASAAPPEVKTAEPYISKDPQGEGGLGQVSEYMHNLLTNQHRRFAYAFYVKWKYARILYFDRAGAVISEPFDWTHSASLLHDFIWKAAHMTLEELGYDPTVQVASEPEIDLLRSKMGDELNALPTEVQQYVLDAFLSTATRQPEATTEDAEDSTTKPKKKAKAKPEVPLDEIPIYQLTVTSSNPSPDEAFPDSAIPPAPSTTPSTSDSRATENENRTFLVGRPYFSASSLTGRCTRGYIAFDLETETFCFLKDSWRPLVPGRSRPEHLVYERLRNHGVHNVSNIATLVCGGDVGGHRAQVTRVQDSIPQENKPVPRVHYRIVVKEIGLPLTEFQNFTELAGIFGDALEAHLAAYEIAGILHRDVSVGNILINPETRCGFLIDWDLSRLASELGQGPMEPDRTGTWQFRSALSLYYLRKPYRLSDDVESFVHTFQYMVLCFHRTTLPGLRTHVQSYFEQSAKAGPFRIGGQVKLGHFRTPQAPFGVVDNHELQGLLNEIARRCYLEFYNLIDEDLMARQYGVEVGSAASANPVPTTVQQAPPAPRRRKNNRAMMLRYQHLDTAPPSSPDPPVPLVDACDIQSGFLSHQFHLMKLFNDFSGAAEDKHEDQFIARAGDEPVKPTPLAPARGIFKMSGSRTRDSSSRPTSVAEPTSVAPSPSAAIPFSLPPPPPPPCGSGSASTDGPSPSLSTNVRTLRKRTQKDRQENEDPVADNGNGNSEGPSSPKEIQKRQRKARS
ncbi:hypothetical protein V8D89_004994 [Ganoderma adspersum]